VCNVLEIINNTTTTSFFTKRYVLALPVSAPPSSGCLALPLHSVRLHHHHNITTRDDLVASMLHHVISYLLVITTLCDDTSTIDIHPLSGQTRGKAMGNQRREKKKKDKSFRAHILPLLCTNVVPSPPLSYSTVATPALSKKALSTYHACSALFCSVLSHSVIQTAYKIPHSLTSTFAFPPPPLLYHHQS
jgi:hypothetical protein